jgi:hypothetical protein
MFFVAHHVPQSGRYSLVFECPCEAQAISLRDALISAIGPVFVCLGWHCAHDLGLV